VIHTAHQVLCGDQIKNDEVGGEYGTWRRKEMSTVLVGKPGEGENLEDLSIDVR